MPTLTLRIAPVLLCVTAAVVCADALAGGVAEPLVHRDGFEALEPAALVREAVERSNSIRIAATEFWADRGVLPTSLGALGFDDPYRVGTALATLQSGDLVLNFGGDLAGESLGFAVWNQAGAWRWTCGNAPPPLDATLLSASDASAHTTLPDALLPDACRSAPSAAALVEEAWIAGAGARTVVIEYRVSVGPPATLADTGLDDPLPVARARLALEDGLLVARFVAPLADETLGIALWEQGNFLRWVCGNAPTPIDATLLSGSTSAARTTLPEALLPQACRNVLPPASQLQDALNVMSWARTAIAEFYANAEALPATLAAAGVPDPLLAGHARIQLEDGVLVATFVGGDLDGKRLGVAPWLLGNSMPWVCGYADPPPGAAPLATGTASEHTTIDAALLPESCR